MEWLCLIAVVVVVCGGVIQLNGCEGGIGMENFVCLVFGGNWGDVYPSVLLPLLLLSLCLSVSGFGLDLDLDLDLDWVLTLVLYL